MIRRHQTRIRLIALVAAGALVVSACGGDDDAAGGDTTATTPADDTTDEVDDADAEPDDDADDEADEADDADDADDEADDGGLTFTGEGGSTDPVEGGTFSYSMFAEPTRYDPHQITAQPDDALIASLAYDTLVGLQPDGSVVGQLAEEFEASDGQLSFVLREGITCQDGTELTASMVQASYERLRDLGTQPTVIPDLGADFTVEADDATRTVVIVPTADNPDALSSLVQPQYSVVCPAGLEAEDFNATSYGTGPFVLESVRPGDRVELVRNDGYAWGRDGATMDYPGVPDRVLAQVVTDETTKANLVVSGQLSAASFLTPANLDRVDVDDFYRTRYPSLTWYVTPNQAEGRPGADPAVRAAIAAVVDRAGMAQVTSGPLGEPLDVVLPPGQACHNPDGVFESPSDGGDLQGVSLTIVGIDLVGNSAELLGSLLEAAGADVDLQIFDAAGFTQAVFVEPAFDVTIWGARWNPTTRFYMSRTSGPNPAEGGANFASMDNADAGAAIDRWAAAEGAEAQCAAASEFEEALLASHDLVPFVTTNTVYVGNGVRYDVVLNRPVPTTMQVVGS